MEGSRAWCQHWLSSGEDLKVNGIMAGVCERGVKITWWGRKPEINQVRQPFLTTNQLPMRTTYKEQSRRRGGHLQAENGKGNKATSKFITAWCLPGDLGSTFSCPHPSDVYLLLHDRQEVFDLKGLGHASDDLTTSQWKVPQRLNVTTLRTKLSTHVSLGDALKPSSSNLIRHSESPILIPQSESPEPPNHYIF